MLSEIEFGAPEFLWGALLAPLLLLLATSLYFRRKRRLRSFASDGALARLAAEASPLRFFIRAISFTVAVVLLMLAAAQPKLGLKPVPVQRRGVDLIIALDVSKSMDASDVVPTRLQRARYSIDSLLQKLGGDRIGLVAFAGEAILVHPLTNMAAGFRITLNTLDTESVPTPGTALGAAIAKAAESYEGTSPRHKVLILITDGETHDENALEQAEKAYEKGIIIYTMGIGSQKGALVPDRMVDGEARDFIREDGRYVISTLNQSLLRDIAKAGKGLYFHFGAPGEEDNLERLYEIISRMGQEEFAAKYKALRNDIYQYPLGAALLLLALEAIIGDRKRCDGGGSEKQ